MNANEVPAIQIRGYKNIQPCMIIHICMHMHMLHSPPYPFPLPCVCVCVYSHFWFLSPFAYFDYQTDMASLCCALPHLGCAISEKRLNGFHLPERFITRSVPLGTPLTRLAKQACRQQQLGNRFALIFLGIRLQMLSIKLIIIEGKVYLGICIYLCLI